MRLIKILILIAIVGLIAYFFDKDKAIAPKDNTPIIPIVDDNTPEPIVVDESIVVEKYLRDNIAVISPVPAVLGGTWYVVSVVVDEVNDTGHIVYEDGHIQEERDFSYVLKSNGEVEKLTFK